MRCPSCECVDDKVVETRVSKDGTSIRRRRECLQCAHRFTTYEVLLRTDAVVVKRDGRREDFDPEKLRHGIRHACWKRPVGEEHIDSLVKKITSELEALQQREVTSSVIGNMVMAELRKVDHVAFVRFASVYRRFEAIDAFIDEIRNLTDGSRDRIGHMIRLSSQRVLVRDPHDCSHPVDLDAVRQNLEDSLRAAGITEKWLAEHVVATILEQADAIRANDTDPDADQAVSRAVVQLLSDAGYSDVAMLFAEARSLSMASAEDQNTYDQQRVSKVLEATFPLSPNATADLALHVVRRLDALAFATVSDALILDVARHELDVTVRARSTADAEAGGWLMPPGYWQGCFSGETAALIRDTILIVHPVSQLFPVARITLDVEKLATQLGPVPLARHAFFPLLRRACLTAAAALERLRSEAVKPPDAGQKAGHLIVHGLTNLTRTRFGRLRRADREALNTDLEAAVRETLIDYGPSHLIIAFA